jgi:hypothetical protein
MDEKASVPKDNVSFRRHRTWRLENMADDKNKTAPQDAARVNVHEGYEVAYWTQKFSCTREQLQAAVKKVGVSPRAVQEELKRR